MKQIPSEIKIPYDALLVKRGVPPTVHFYYRKWVRFYLDFCLKYHHERFKKENLSHFIEKLKSRSGRGGRIRTRTSNNRSRRFTQYPSFHEIKNTD